MTEDDNSLTGLSGGAGNLLYRAGLTTRRAVIDAGPVAWLKIPGFGKIRCAEVNRWLGADSPSHRNEIERCIKILERDGYTVLPPNA
ncbi:MAG: hypothetical protein L0H37_01120 [Nitrosospira sp.]|nr:hypothetical protein [Nitrosospira sp.]